MFTMDSIYMFITDPRITMWRGCDDERERERELPRKEGRGGRLFAMPTKAPPAYVLGEQLGAAGKDKVVHAARASDGRLVAVAQYHPRKGSNIRVEAAQQERAASVGLAPRLYHINPQRRQLVMELLSGGTLIEIAQRQNGRLHVGQQRRIIELLSRLGLPTEEGGAGLRHGDCGNPANYVADANGLLHIIDFAPPHCKNLPTSMPHDQNLNSLGVLLWHPDKGLVRRGWVTESPVVLLREYRLFCRRSGQSDPMDPNPDDILPKYDTTDEQPRKIGRSRSRSRSRPQRARTPARDRAVHTSDSTQSSRTFGGRTLFVISLAALVFILCNLWVGMSTRAASVHQTTETSSS